MHDHTDPLANTKSGTLTITEDERGVAFVADIGDTQRATEIRDLVRRGVVSEMSIGFVVNHDTWDGTTSRTITSARLHEVSLVENAAYKGTIAAVREESKMPIKEDRARVAELKNEYPSANEERQLAILEEINDAEERIASEKSVLEARMKAPAALTSATRAQTPAKDEVREWFRGGFRSNRAAIGINIGSGTANLTTNATMPVLSNEFVKSLDQESIIRSLVTVETRGVDTDIPVIANRMTAVLIGEGAAYQQETMTASKISFKSWKSGITTDVSEEALQDTVWDLASQIVSEHGRAHGRLWEGFYATGTGTNQPKGMFAESWTTSYTTAATGLPTVDDLVSAAMKLNPQYHASASWLMNQATWGNIIKSSTSGKYLLNGENGNILRDGAAGLFLGKPVYLSEFAPTAATAGTVSALFGDFKRGYRVIDRAAVTFTVDDLSQASNGLIRYSSRMRSDAKGVDMAAVCKVVIKT
jgi:HK97 family phage major capsid protein